jgi:hypothetical protein
MTPASGCAVGDPRYVLLAVNGIERLVQGANIGVIAAAADKYVHG